LDDTLGKILAIQSILSDSLNEEIKLESAAEKEIQEKSVAERNKTTE
jgi:hypothetical protein